MKWNENVVGDPAYIVDAWPNTKQQLRDYIELDMLIINFSYHSSDSVITVPADALAPAGAKPSARSVLSAKLDMIFFNVSLAVMHVNHLEISQAILNDVTCSPRGK